MKPSGHAEVAPLLSRMIGVDDLPEEGLEVSVVATAEERAALAREFGLVALESLSARFHVLRRARKVVVTGKVEGEVVQTCVVTLDPFAASVAEDVAVTFVDALAPGVPSAGTAGMKPSHKGKETAEPRHDHQTDLDEPDPIVDGQIDLGALAAEFLALGLDPYPRKPGATFPETHEDRVSGASPFAALRALKPDGRG